MDTKFGMPVPIMNTAGRQIMCSCLDFVPLLNDHSNSPERFGRKSREGTREALNNTPKKKIKKNDTKLIASSL